MENLCKDFTRQISFLLSNFKFCSTDVKYHLMKRYCMSVYGVVLYDLMPVYANSLCTTWRKCICRLFDLDIRTHSMYMSLTFNDLPCEAQLHLRFINFINKTMSTSNNIVRLCTNSAISGSRSSTYRNINCIRWRYDITVNDCCTSAHSRGHYNVVGLLLSSCCHMALLSWLDDLPCCSSESME